MGRIIGMSSRKRKVVFARSGDNGPVCEVYENVTDSSLRRIDRSVWRGAWTLVCWQPTGYDAAREV